VTNKGFKDRTKAMAKNAQKKKIMMIINIIVSKK